jgi:hypothetical protein
MSSLDDAALWRLQCEAEHAAEPDKPPASSAAPAPPGREQNALIRIARALHLWESSLSVMETSLRAGDQVDFVRQLQLGRNEILDALAGAGIGVENPLSRPFEEVADVVEVRGWRRQADLTREVVVQVIEPILRRDGVLLRPGQVIVGQPAPAAIPPSPGGGLVESPGAGPSGQERPANP